MKIIRAILIIAFALLIQSCPMDVDYPSIDVSFFNNSSINIEIVSKWFAYPNKVDTSYFMEQSDYIFNINILPDICKETTGFFLSEKECKCDTLSIYIIEKDVFENNSLAEILKNNLEIGRYDLSDEDLELLIDSVMPYDNYISTISFPPSPEMRTMHIYPSYDEILERCENKEN